MSEIKTFLWDLDGVVWTYRKDETQIVLNSLSIPNTKENLERFSKEYLKMIENFNILFRNQRVTMPVYRKHIATSMPILEMYGISVDYFIKVWHNIMPSLSRVNPTFEYVARYLNRKGIKLVAVSDWFFLDQAYKLDEYGVLKYFDRLWCIHDGYLKPNPNYPIYDVVNPSLKSTYIMIGDNPYADVGFASRAQIPSIWYNPNRNKNNSIFVPTHEIRKLSEIQDIV